jgi:MSHA biogenesis protein MshL
VRSFVVLVALAAGVSLAAQDPSGPTGGAAGLPVSRLEGAEEPAFRQVAPAPSRPEQLPPLPVTRLDERPRADLDGPRTVSVTFSQPLPITEVLMLLVRGTAFSVVTEASITGTFIGELKDLTMRQALEAVLFPLALDYVVEDNVIRVFERRPETRLFEVNYLTVRRSLQRRLDATLTIGEAPSAELFSATGSDVFAEVDAGVKALLSPSGRSHVDRKAGLVQVTDFRDRLDRVAAYLDAVHVRVNRQVRLDARVFEVTVAQGPGIDWTAVAGRVGSPLRAAAPGIATAGLRVESLAALVEAIGEQGVVRMIAAPHTLAMNNEPAVMRAGTDEVYFRHARTQTTTGRADAARIDEAVTVAEGLMLTVTPHISADGIVQLNVAPVWSQRTGQVKSPEGSLVPVLRVSESDTVLRVQDGETVVISGLLQERTEARLSTGFSGLFGAQERRTVSVELVVLLTPTVVVPGAGAREGI